MGVSFGANKDVLKLDCGEGCTTLNILKNCWIVHFKSEIFGYKTSGCEKENWRNQWNDADF